MEVGAIDLRPVGTSVIIWLCAHASCYFTLYQPFLAVRGALRAMTYHVASQSIPSLNPRETYPDARSRTQNPTYPEAEPMICTHRTKTAMEKERFFASVRGPRRGPLALGAKRGMRGSLCEPFSHSRYIWVKPTNREDERRAHRGPDGAW